MKKIKLVITIVAALVRQLLHCCFLLDRMNNLIIMALSGTLEIKYKN